MMEVDSQLDVSIELGYITIEQLVGGIKLSVL